MPVYCITLVEEPWKQDFARKEFDSIGIQPEFIHGFFGATLGILPGMACEVYPDGKQTFMHVNQLAHTLSYLMVLRFAIMGGHQEFLVVEDDVTFLPGFKERWDTCLESFRKFADVVQLEYCGSEDKVMEPLDEHVSRCYYPFNAAAIWWTRPAAEMAIKQIRPICDPTDVALIRRVYPFMSHAIVTPPLCGQKSSHGVWPSAIGISYKPV